MAFARFLPKDILARASGVCTLPLCAADTFARISGDRVCPLWYSLIACLCSSVKGWCFFPRWDEAYLSTTSGGRFLPRLAAAALARARGESCLPFLDADMFVRASGETVLPRWAADILAIVSGDFLRPFILALSFARDSSGSSAPSPPSRMLVRLCP